MTGVISRIFLTRGFGFIKGEDGEDRFFHIDKVKGEWEGLRQGMVVDFTPVETGHGGNKLRAVDVVVKEVARAR